MKKFALILFTGATLAMTACGGEEKPAETVTPSEVEGANNMMNNLLQQGVQEATEQLKDSSSMLNKALDTLKDVVGENQELIDDKLEEGINALNKSF